MFPLIHHPAILLLCLACASTLFSTGYLYYMVERLSVPEEGPMVAALFARSAHLAYELPTPVRIHLTATPLLVFTCRRAHYLNQTLTELLRYHPANTNSNGHNDNEASNSASAGTVIASPIVISQDGNDPSVAEVISTFRVEFGRLGVPMYDIVHVQIHRIWRTPFQNLAVHYGWALDELFSGKAYSTGSASSNITAIASALGHDNTNFPEPLLPQRIIIMEEDVKIARDFYSYFSAMIPILDSDPSLLAASAFNDNGKSDTVGDPRRLVRSDFFPGLGWMLTRKVWEEGLGPKWPQIFWDDWLRHPVIKQGRQFIRPEVSRTLHIGEKGGASENEGGHHLSAMYLNDVEVQWTEQDLSYLGADVFRSLYYRRVFDAKPSSEHEALAVAEASDVRVEYANLTEYVKLAKRFNLHENHSAGTLRSAYENIVDFRPSSPSDDHGADNGDDHVMHGGEVGKYLVFITPPVAILRKNYKKGKQLTREDFSKKLALDNVENFVNMSYFKRPLP